MMEQTKKGVFNMALAQLLSLAKHLQSSQNLISFHHHEQSGD